MNGVVHNYCKYRCSVKMHNVSLQKAVVFFSALAICDSLISLYVSIIPTIIRYGILFIWFIVSVLLIERRRRLDGYIKNLCPIVAYIALLLLKFTIGADTSDSFWTPTRFLLDAISLVFCITMVYSVTCLSNRYKSILIKLFLLLATITVIPSLIYVQSYPDAVRDAYDGFANVNFSYIYASVSTITMAVYMFKSRGVRNRILVFIFLLLNISLILLANFATAFLGVLTGIVLMLFCTRRRKFKSIIIVLCVGVLLVFWLRGAIAKALYSVAEFGSFSSIMRYRIRAVGDFLLGRGGGSSFGNRFELMRLSWNSFLKHPLLGIPFLEFSHSTIGMHETWITMLGGVGIIGTLFYVVAIILMLKSIMRSIKVKQFTVAYKVVLLLYLFLSFLNPMGSRDMIIAAFVIVPLFESLFKQNEFKEFHLVGLL